MKTINRNKGLKNLPGLANKISLGLTLSMAALSILACTKELPYQEQFKPDLVMEKSVIDTESDYLMSSSMLNASRSSQDALPFSAGDNKRVRMRWEEKSLVIYEMDRDKRFRDNPTNNKLVMEIPVEHKDFECAKDKYGDCTNTETDKNVTWKFKSKFVIRPEAAKSARLEILPILLDAKIGLGFCYNEIGSKVVDLKIEKDAMNMAVERTFEVSPFCTDIQELSDSTVSAVYHYSLVKTSSVLSPGFKTVNYPKLDENTFGFFSTQRQDLDTDNNTTARGEVSIMNHWNPRRKEINYFLTDNFYKPENKRLLELTHQVFDSLNLGLKNAGAQFRLNIKEDKGKSPGDIRNSMIVLVEDPVASSVIGYGPQIEDPATGEIVSARTVMFLGTIKTFIQNTYADILKEKRKTKLANQPQQPTPASVDSPQNSASLESALAVKLSGSQYLGKAQTDMIVVGSSAKLARYIKGQSPSTPSSGNSSIDPVQFSKVASIQKELKDITKRKNSVYTGDVQAHFQYLKEAKNCAFGLGAESLSAISPKLMAAIPDDAKPWAELNESEKDAMIALILPEVWVPTLIHEMGHNLGLRHNFGGSQDIANFYSQDELKNVGIENTVPSSTVMEYIDDLKALPVLGKYDIAALKFAYAKKIQLADGREIPVQGTIKETLDAAAQRGDLATLKDYKYCTDEHTGINADCRRFDLGITNSDIIANAIESYQDRYEFANQRAGRANFSLFDDPGYLARTQARFESMRLMQEVYARIKSDFNLSDADPIWDEFEFLKDLKQASAMTGKFLMDVLATPDLTCVLTHAGAPGQIADIQRLDNIDKNQISCFALNDSFAANQSPWRVIGQFGKSFQSKKDPNSENSYADQIDVRGVWMDKLAAAKVLFKRDMGVSSLDENTDNFTDRADIGPELMALAQGMLLNKASAETAVEWIDGSQEITTVPVDSKLTIAKPIHPALAKMMGLPNDSVAFSKLLVSTLNKNMVDNSHQLSGAQMMEAFKVISAGPQDKFPVNTHKKVEIAGQLLVAGPTNTMAQSAMGLLADSQILSAIPLKKVSELLKLKKAGHTKIPTGSTPEEKAVWNMKNEKIEAFLKGEIEAPQFYQELLLGLPQK